jgi:hypothetical protein
MKAQIIDGSRRESGDQEWRRYTGALHPQALTGPVKHFEHPSLVNNVSCMSSSGLSIDFCN